MPGTGGLLATPLATWERDGLKAALVKAGLPAEDVTAAKSLFWRFETAADIPALARVDPDGKVLKPEAKTAVKKQDNKERKKG